MGTQETQEPIELNDADLRVLAKHMPAVQAGRRAQETMSDYIAGIITHSGGDPNRKYRIVGKRIIFPSIEQNPDEQHETTSRT